jgi:RNA polymerase sigma-70 factor (TIGR02943 family)
MAEHGEVLHRFAMARLRNADVAADVVQETLLAALGNCVQFTGSSDERTWLVSILRRKIADYYRARHRVVTTEISQPTEWDESSHAEQRDSEASRGDNEANTAAERREFWAIIRTAVSKLGAPLAAAFVLYEIEELKSPEVCRILGISRRNLWTRLHRARLLLREHLELHWAGTACDLAMERSACT